MNIDYEAKVLEIFVIPEQGGQNNIVKKVTWRVTFFDPDFRRTVMTQAKILTYLDTDTLSDSFVDYSLITQSQILQLCLDHEGGSSFLQNLQGLHEPVLQSQYNDRLYEIRPPAELEVG